MPLGRVFSMTGTFCACEGTATPIQSATASQAGLRPAQKPRERREDFNTALGQQQTQHASTGRISKSAKAHTSLAQVRWIWLRGGQQCRVDRRNVVRKPGVWIVSSARFSDGLTVENTGGEPRSCARALRACVCRRSLRVPHRPAFFQWRNLP